MPIIQKAEERKTLTKITIEENIFTELMLYVKYLGYEKKRETEGLGKVIDGALGMLFRSEQRNSEYKKFKEEFSKINNQNKGDKSEGEADKNVQPD